jgi:aspartate aminotransferase
MDLAGISGRRGSARAAGLGRSATVSMKDTLRALAAAGVDVLDLSGGEPFFATPAPVTAAAVAALEGGETHYTASRGVPRLCAAVAGKLRRDSGIVVDPDREVIVTPSAKHALFLGLAAVLDPGDEVVVPTPAWVSYRPMAALLGARAVAAPTAPEEGFALTRDRLAAAIGDRSRVLILNTPNNPTGRMLGESELDLVAELAEAHDLIVVADEIYERIRYDGGVHRSPAAHPALAARTLTVNGFSKAYAMTGWRLGYLAGPADLVGEALKVQEHTVSCASSFVQAGAIAALEDGRGEVDAAVRAMLQRYRENRDLVVAGLDALPGVSCRRPQGAFYALADVRGTGFASGAAFAAALLERTGVALAPGEAFGPGGEGQVRLAFAERPERLREALERISVAVHDLAAPVGLVREQG